jgi:hypothetical protein
MTNSQNKAILGLCFLGCPADRAAQLVEDQCQAVPSLADGPYDRLERAALRSWRPVGLALSRAMAAERPAPASPKPDVAELVRAEVVGLRAEMAELRGSLEILERRARQTAPIAQQPAPNAPKSTGEREAAIEALVGLGDKRSVAEALLRRAMAETPTLATADEMIPAMLRLR